MTPGTLTLLHWGDGKIRLGLCLDLAENLAGDETVFGCMLCWGMVTYRWASKDDVQWRSTET